MASEVSRPPLVSVARCGEYEPALLESALARALDPLGSIAAFVPAGATVLLKPNLLKKAAPDAAVTTHPELVRAVLRAVRAAGAGDVIVADSPGGPQSARSFRSLAEASGLLDVCGSEGATLVPLQETARAEVPEDGPGHVRYRRFELGREALEADVLIDLPKLKTHGLMMMTGAVKNLFGLIPGLAKAGYHLTVPEREDFAEMLVDLALACPPRLTVMDAVVAMEGQGPGGGEPRRVGALLASADPFALDVLAAALCGFRPEEVYTIAAARRRGLAPASAEGLETAGDDWRALVVRDFRKPPGDISGLFPSWSVGRLREALLARPRLARPGECTGCAICAASCPADAVSMREAPDGGRMPVFDDDACIRCYCCHEMCPPQAIELRTPWLLRWISRREQGRA